MQVAIPTNYMEENDFFPQTVFGCRSNISAQDVLLQLKEEVLKKVATRGEQIVMALDIKGACNNVSHEAILTALDDLNCAKRVRGYLKAFLSNLMPRLA